MTLGPKTGISGVEMHLGETLLISRIRAGRAICWMSLWETSGKTTSAYMVGLAESDDEKAVTSNRPHCDSTLQPISVVP
jgi:hypothetical protein